LGTFSGHARESTSPERGEIRNLKRDNLNSIADAIRSYTNSPT
jgi:hypothetical protein